MIRFALEKDIPKIGELLLYIDKLHHDGRPDIFKIGRKYSDEELAEIINNPQTPVLVATSENDEVTGYCFCIYQQYTDNSVLSDIKTLYIDDLCVDERYRGKHIGKSLYEAAVKLAKENNCYNLTLNVWSFNTSAIKFYESCGLKPQKTYMETIL